MINDLTTFRCGFPSFDAQKVAKSERTTTACITSSSGAMPSTHKKVIVRKLDRDAVQGYLAPASFVRDGKLELLNTAGKMVLLDLGAVKGVYFVREFNDAEGLSRKTFAGRPRSEGLWVRLKFRDNDILEGMMPNDLAQLAAEGFFVNAPDTRSKTQRIF